MQTLTSTARAFGAESTTVHRHSPHQKAKTSQRDNEQGGYRKNRYYYVTKFQRLDYKP